MDTQTIDNVDKKLSRKYSSEVPNEVIENQTKKIPNLVFLGLASASIVASAILAFRSGKSGTKKTDLANFVGQWAPTILLFGLYNKIVKVEDEILSQSQDLQDLH